MYYDEKERIIHYKSGIDGYEYWQEYNDETKEMIYYDNMNFRESYLYNEDDNSYHSKDFKYLDFGYDNRGNCTYRKNNNHYCEWMEYDDNDRLIHSKDSEDNEEWFEHDELGRLIHFKDNNGYEESYEYNKNNSKIHLRTSLGLDEIYKYDENNNIIYSKNNYGDEKHYSYEYYEE